MTSFLESYIRTVPQCGHGGRSWTNGYWFSLCHCNLLIAVWLPDTKDNAAPFSFLNNTVRMDLLSIHIVIVIFSNVRAIKVDIAYEHIFFSFFSFWKRPPTIICDGKRGLEVVFFHVSFSRVCVFVCVHQCTYIYIFCRETSRSATGGRGGGTGKEVEEIRMVFIRFQGYLNRRKWNTSVSSSKEKNSNTKEEEKNK